jgi:transcriptional regulator with XRE-family HTH domain
VLTAPDLLKEARHAAGLTQATLAERLGVSQSEVARLEKRGANPRFQTLVDAIEAAGHSLQARVEPRRPTVDESMIAASLRMPPAERLRQFEAAYLSVSDLARDARRSRGS